MRVSLLLTACMALFLGSCSSNKSASSHAPPPLDKDLLPGKWENESTVQFLSRYEFSKDGTVTMTFRGMKEPVKTRYSWSSDRTVGVDYPKEEQVRKDYEKAAEAYKEDVRKKIESKELSDRAGPSLLGMVPDTMPEKEALHVGIGDPKFLILQREDGTRMNFNRID